MYLFCFQIFDWNYGICQGPIVSGHVFISLSNTSNSACCFGDALRCVAFSCSKHGASQSALDGQNLKLMKVWHLFKNSISRLYQSKFQVLHKHLSKSNKIKRVVKSPSRCFTFTVTGKTKVRERSILLIESQLMEWAKKSYSQMKDKSINFKLTPTLLCCYEYRVFQKDRYGQIWLFHRRGRIFIKICWYGIKGWLFAFKIIALLFAYKYSCLRKFIRNLFNSNPYCHTLFSLYAFNPNITCFFCSL